ncbi:hypothetical protein OA90_01635 [Labrenzia sp. OB1]|nr:hypothetical protein OA90_01635 [Labrenzia sp. OB1]
MFLGHDRLSRFEKSERAGVRPISALHGRSIKLPAARVGRAAFFRAEEDRIRSRGTSKLSNVIPKKEGHRT